MHKAYFDGIEGCLTCLSKPVYPGIEIAYRFYGTNKMRQLRNLKEPLGVTNDKVFLGFTTYTHYNVDGNTGSILNAPIDSFIALKGNNGRYVTNKDLKKPLICKRPFVSYEEVFKVVHAGWDKVALSNNNKYVSLEDGDGYINCHTLSIGINQKFSWIDAGDKLILLRGSNNAFVSANEGSEKGITCTTVKPGNDEIFQFEIADLNQLQYSLNKK